MPLRRLSAARHSIGGFSRGITILAPGGRNPVDGSNYPPSPIFEKVYADIRSLRGQELDKAQQIAQEADHMVSIPYQTGITLAMLVEFESRIFQIKYIEDEDERHVFLDLYCAEVGQNAGSQQ
jgi:SPP1 family predicted phage head-tail adaptor